MYGVKKEWVKQNPHEAAAMMTRMREIICREMNNVHEALMFHVTHRQVSSMKLHDQDMTSEDIAERVDLLARKYCEMAETCTMPLYEPQDIDAVERSSVHRAMGFVYGRLCSAHNNGEDIRELEVPAIVEEYRRTLSGDEVGG